MCAEFKQNYCRKLYNNMNNACTMYEFCRKHCYFFLFFFCNRIVVVKASRHTPMQTKGKARKKKMGDFFRFVVLLSVLRVSGNDVGILWSQKHAILHETVVFSIYDEWK